MVASINTDLQQNKIFTVHLRHNSSHTYTKILEKCASVCVCVCNDLRKVMEVCYGIVICVVSLRLVYRFLELAGKGGEMSVI